MLPIAVCQMKHSSLIHRYREQAPSHTDCSSAGMNADLTYIASRTGIFQLHHMTFNALQCFHIASIVSLD